MYCIIIENTQKKIYKIKFFCDWKKWVGVYWPIISHGFETIHSEFCLNKCMYDFYISPVDLGGWFQTFLKMKSMCDFSYSVTLSYEWTQFFFRAFSFQLINPSTLKDERRPAHNILRGCNFWVYRKIRKDPIPMWTFVTKSLAKKKNDLGKTAFLVAIEIGKLVEFSVKNIKFNTNQTICFIWNEGRYEYSPPIFASVLSSRLLILHLLVISKNVWSTE